ncbi:protocadherin Fat 3-like [Lineus longissimus]|uniref:protocadherin Fat 3-like n=1 Tax=Lineus longissimus TaxID=88925 RepID=UPI002B4CF2AE
MKSTLLFSAVVLTAFAVANGDITFSSTPYEANVDENLSIGSVLIAVSATSSLGAEVTYSIVAKDDSPATGVSINAVSGEITLSEFLDYESVTQMQFTIKASALGTASKLADINTEPFTLNILDVNDNTPVFAALSYSATVEQYGTYLPNPISVFATDADSTTNAQITYAFVSGNTGNAFQINANTGEITQAAVINMGETTSFTLVVSATDAGGPALSTTVLVNVAVDTTEYSCPKWMERFGSKCYKLVRGLKTYDRAQATCEKYGTKSGLGNGNLATVYDQFRQNFIANELMNVRHRVWIGLDDKDTEGTMVWIDGTPYSYSNWSVVNGVQQPAGGSDKNCVAIEARARLGGWNDVKCSIKSWSVCQFPASAVATPL